MKRVLIDTDVILDFFFNREPFSENSAKILSYCERKQIKGFVTPVIFSNTYYLLRKTAGHKKVIEKLTQLLSFIDVLTMDRDVVYQALISEFTDFEDALQNYAAVKHGKIDAIITRNIKDFKKSEIAILTPDNFVTAIKG
jgi:predicted nucleic acid-binding protein